MHASAHRKPRPATGPIPAAIWLLLVGQFVVRSCGFAYPFMTYLLSGDGYGPATAAGIIAIFGLAAVAGQLGVGWAADRIGRGPTLATAMAVTAATLPILATVHTVPVLMTLAAVSGATYQAYRPVIAAMITDRIPDKTTRTKAFSIQHFANNVGAGIPGAYVLLAAAGTAGGLTSAHTGIRGLFWINAAACAALALLALTYRQAPRPAASTNQTGGYRHAAADRSLWLLLLASIGPLTCILATTSTIPILMAADGLPPASYGIVSLANPAAVLILTALLIGPISRYATRPAAAVRLMVASGVILAAGVGGAALAHTTLGYSLGVIASIPGEVAFFPAALAVLTTLAPADAIGRYIGVFETEVAAAMIPGPLLASWSLTHGGHPTAAALVATTAPLTAAACALLARSLHHTPSPSELARVPAAAPPTPMPGARISATAPH